MKQQILKVIQAQPEDADLPVAVVLLLDCPKALVQTTHFSASICEARSETEIGRVQQCEVADQGVTASHDERCISCG